LGTKSPGTLCSTGDPTDYKCRRRRRITCSVFRHVIHRLRAACLRCPEIHRQWLRIWVDIPVAHWLRIWADNFYLFNDLSPRIVRTSACHRRSCSTSTCICSLTRGKWLQIRVDIRTYDTSTRIRSTQAKDTGRRASGTSAGVYSPCATDTGKQGELDLCRYLHI